jgi:hypothetical protein
MLGHATAAMTLDLYGHLFDVDLSGVAGAGKAVELLRYHCGMGATTLQKDELLQTGN